MVNHWPEWNQQEVNWQQQGSYVEPLEVPLPDPTAGTLVCLPPLNEACLRYVAGCLDQLRNPSTYDGLSDTDIATSLVNADLLRGMLARAVPCEAPVSYDLRLNACVLESSTDGGATWAAVAGWDGFAACLPSLATEALSVPSNPLGVSTAQQGCNIAGYVANQIIQGVVSTLQNAISEGRSAIQFATDLTLGAFIFRSVFPITTAALLGIDALLSFGSSVGAAELLTIAGDVTLWDEVKCAIYYAIGPDGRITATNWPTAISNIRAISYGVPGVIGAIADWLTSVDIATVYEWQQLAPIDSVDCTDCRGAPWCYTWTGGGINTPVWGEGYEFGTGPLVHGVVSGSELDSVLFPASHVQVLAPGQVFASTWIHTVRVVYANTNGDSGAGHYVQCGTGAKPLNYNAGAWDTTVTIDAAVTELEIVLATRTDGTSVQNKITLVEVHGAGTCPFGTPNC